MKKDRPKILIVNPWIHDFAAYDFWAKPIGLLLIASILKRAGCRVHYIDCLDRFHPMMMEKRHEKGKGAYIKTRIKKPAIFSDIPRRFSRYGIKPEWLVNDLNALPRPDLIMVTSMMTYWYTGVKETIGVLKKRYKNTPILLGGIYATLMTAHARKASGTDTVIPGRLGRPFVESFTGITGYSLDLAGRGIDLDIPDTWPYPAFDLQSQIPYVPILTSLGCPFGCPYCASSLLQPQFLRRSPESAAAELAYWHEKYGVKDFAIYDDAFLFDAQRHAMPFLEMVLSKGLEVTFHVPNALHARFITKDVARMLKKAGFSSVRLGAEVLSPDKRADIDSKLNLDEFIKAVNLLKSAGFTRERIKAYLLVGLPGQSKYEIMESIESVKKAGAIPVIAYFSPIPGTGLWEEACRSSRYDLRSDPLLTNNSIMPCSKSPFSWEAISDLKRRAAG